MAHTMPLVAVAGGTLRFAVEGGSNLIGPSEERWDLVLLISYPSVAALMGMLQSPDYLAGSGHRTAAVEDSRLLPIVETMGG